MAAVASTLLSAFPSMAMAQFVPYGDNCNPCPPVAACNPCPPVIACNPCPQPIVQVQPCYQTVPVTEFRRVKQVVQRPVCETRYVDQTVTAYRPVCETKTCQVPTVTYHPVTECRTVYRDMGRWVTSYRCVNKLSPCDYDNRPNLLGWMNRTGYEVRSAFTPNVVACRQYVPNVVAQQIPYTRQVAQHGVRNVSYNVTRMVAYQTTQKVAVNNVRYVAQEVEVNQPVTVYRSVPIGTTLAFGYPSYGGAMSYGDRNSAPANALRPTPDPINSADRIRRDRTANSLDNRDRGATNEPFRPDNFEKRDSSRESSRDGKPGNDIRRSSYEVPVRSRYDEPRYEDRRNDEDGPQVRRERAVPTAVRTSRWMARSQPRRTTGQMNPTLADPTISVADR